MHRCLRAVEESANIFIATILSLGKLLSRVLFSFRNLLALRLVHTTDLLSGQACYLLPLEEICWSD
jgi:hypothetical protein